MTPPVVTFPEEVAEHVRFAYQEAKVILEYGSGGSTWIAAQMRGKLIFSVESDFNWALDMQRFFDQEGPPSLPTVYYVNIGETGNWGRPVDDSHWRDFHNYPMKIWDEPFFRHPDTILIDGRFRAACMATALLRIKKPVKVLFDDYVEREKYHVVETFAKPVRTIGRMAEFHLVPDSLPPDKLTLAFGLFGQATFATKAAKPAP